MPSIVNTLDRPVDLSSPGGFEVSPTPRNAKIALAAMFRSQGMPTSEIARRLDVDRTTVWRWLKGFGSEAAAHFAP